MVLTVHSPQCPGPGPGPRPYLAPSLLDWSPGLTSPLGPDSTFVSPPDSTIQPPHRKVLMSRADMSSHLFSHSVWKVHRISHLPTTMQSQCPTLKVVPESLFLWPILDLHFWGPWSLKDQCKELDEGREQNCGALADRLRNSKSCIKETGKWGEFIKINSN